MPCQGLSAARICGARKIAAEPKRGQRANHRIITGPKMRPTFAVPRDCSRNSPIRMISDSGITSGSKAGLAALRPSTAESTEIAGVSMPSPKNSASPMMAARADQKLGAPAEAWRAMGERGQRQHAAFAVIVGAQDDGDIFQVTTRISDQKISDVAPRIAKWPGVAPPVAKRGFAQGVKRAGADVAIDDAERAKCQGQVSAG